jgi:hypothetical protein
MPFLDETKKYTNVAAKSKSATLSATAQMQQQQRFQLFVANVADELIKKSKTVKIERNIHIHTYIALYAA